MQISLNQSGFILFQYTAIKTCRSMDPVVKTPAI